jgi:hypothetical protein
MMAADPHMNEPLGERLDRIDAQLAGVLGMVAALIEVAPTEQRKEALEKMVLSLEMLHASVLADTGPHSEGAVRGVQTLREVLLGKLAS